jgi:septal ring factor EnvC (AmiA/AmiB activator)
MLFGLFKKNKEINKIKEEVQESFNLVKEDFNKVGKWIKHLDDNKEDTQKELEELKKQIFTIQNEIEEIKDFISLFGAKISKQQQTTGVKQTGVVGVQTAVQTAVQTSILENLTLMERAILWALVNSENRLSYEDLSVLLGKDKSTIRGQINAIKQKSESLISESRESNGKKRLFVTEEMKQFILKNAKVRVRQNKKVEKNSEKESVE